jgi:dephospho-CoA kinase
MLIGLTGAFASGKSAVARMMEERGAATLDADELARQAVEPGSTALEEIRRVFGPEYLKPDGALDRRRMGELVFSRPDSRARLNAIIHPWVIDEMDRRIRELRSRGKDAPRCIALNVPLLFEVGMERKVDKTVVVVVDEARRFMRARKRDGLSEREIVNRLAAQWPQRLKARLADYIVDNSGSLEETRRQVDALFREWFPGDKS